MQKKVNIDECYLALINSYENESKINKIKFTIVKYDVCGEYKDLMSDEKYKTNSSEFYKTGSLFVNENYFLLPLNSLIRLDNKFINIKKLLNLVKDSLINVNYLLYTGEKYKIMNI